MFLAKIENFEKLEFLLAKLDFLVKWNLLDRNYYKDRNFSKKKAAFFEKKK